MSPSQADLIARALDLLSHVEGRTKQHDRGLDTVRRLLVAVQEDEMPRPEPLGPVAGVGLSAASARRQRRFW